MKTEVRVQHLVFCTEEWKFTLYTHVPQLFLFLPHLGRKNKSNMTTTDTMEETD